MDHKDRQIIRALQADGRMTNQELSQKVNLSPSPCLRRLRNLEQSGVIRGYSVDIDPKLYGLPLSVFIRVRLEHHNEADVQTFENQIHRLDQVLECYVMAGRIRLSAPGRRGRFGRLRKIRPQAFAFDWLHRVH